MRNNHEPPPPPLVDQLQSVLPASAASVPTLPLSSQPPSQLPAPKTGEVGRNPASPQDWPERDPPLLGLGPGQRGREGKERRRREGAKRGPHAPFWQLVLLARSSMGPARTDRRAGCWRPGFPGAGAGGRDSSPAWPACQRLPGSAPGVERMTRPRGGRSSGRSHPESWATRWAGGPALEQPAEGRTPSRGAEAAALPERESPRRAPGGRQGGRVPGRRPPRDAGTAPGCVPSVREMMDPQTVGEGEFFRAEEEVGKVGVGRGTAARWSPPGSGGGPRPWVSPFLSAFLASSFPASLPGSFIQHRSDLCWALAHNRHTVSRRPINGPYLSVE